MRFEDVPRNRTLECIVVRAGGPQRIARSFDEFGPARGRRASTTAPAHHQPHSKDRGLRWSGRSRISQRRRPSDRPRCAFRDRGAGHAGAAGSRASAELGKSVKSGAGAQAGIGRISTFASIPENSTSWEARWFVISRCPLPRHPGVSADMAEGSTAWKSEPRLLRIRLVTIAGRLRLGLLDPAWPRYCFGSTACQRRSFRPSIYS